jgi:hypothetical protein
MVTVVGVPFGTSTTPTIARTVIAWLMTETMALFGF